MNADAAESPRPADLIVIADDLTLPASELRYRFSRAGGPGGQHVNRSETRVELLFDVGGSPSLTEAQRARLLNRLAGYIGGDGVLRLVSTAGRSQLANRAEVTARFRALLATALRRQKRRVPTRPGPAAVQARLAGKRARAKIKEARRRVDDV